MPASMRPMPRTWSHFHPFAWVWGHGDLMRGGQVHLGGPAGPVSRGDGSDIGYNGMDPSDPGTWVRPYNPVGGMVALLNFDPFLGEGGERTGPRDLKYWQAPGRPKR